MRYRVPCSALALVLSALVAPACSESLAEPLATQATPQYVSNVQQRAHRLVVRSVAAEEEEVSAQLDARGGELRAGGHILSVPRNAVTEPTVFTMRVVPGSHIHVDLTAVRAADGTAVVRFQPGSDVKLRLSYQYGVVTNERLLRVAQLVDGTTSGSRQVVRSTVDVNGKFVDAKLNHFSSYAMAID